MTRIHFMGFSRTALLALCASAALSAQAQYLTDDPRLPSPHYVGHEDTFYLNNCRASFFDIFVDWGDRVQPPEPGYFIDSFFDITYRIDFDGAPGPLQPEMGNSQMRLLIANGGTGGTGESFFDIEILILELRSVQPIMIRESPTMPSLGKSTLRDMGGGMWHIDSFFDVFTDSSTCLQKSRSTTASRGVLPRDRRI